MFNRDDAHRILDAYTAINDSGFPHDWKFTISIKKTGTLYTFSFSNCNKEKITLKTHDSENIEALVAEGIQKGMQDEAEYKIGQEVWTVIEGEISNRFIKGIKRKDNTIFYALSDWDYWSITCEANCIYKTSEEAAKAAIQYILDNYVEVTE